MFDPTRELQSSMVKADEESFKYVGWGGGESHFTLVVCVPTHDLYGQATQSAEASVSRNLSSNLLRACSSLASTSPLSTTQASRRLLVRPIRYPDRIGMMDCYVDLRDLAI